MAAAISEKQDMLLEIKHISKSFPGVKALQKVNLTLRRGEVLALVGENGAGKSTLMKILTGVYQRDSGEGDIVYDGKSVAYKGPQESKNDGIVMIFQELSLVMDVTVAENVYLGSLPYYGRSSIVNHKKLYADTKAILEESGCAVSPRAIVRTLPIAQQQMVEIARASALGAHIVIFDEPTSSLTAAETELLFQNIERLKARGVGIIYISHKMDEIFRISDRITVLRDGQNSCELVTGQTDMDQVVQAMIGRNLTDFFYKNKAQKGRETLRVEKLTLNGVFSDISFSVRKGEVVGLYGLVGAGRTEIVETIFGVREKSAGEIYLNGEKVHIRNSSDAVKHGICLVPENRKEQGLVLRASCRDNIGLAKLPQLTNTIGVVDDKEVDGLYESYRKKLQIASPSPNQKVLYLSGGNQQKIVIAKWLSLVPDLLILDEPTRGIDVGFKSEIHKLTAQLAEQGMAVIVISSEMPEIMGVSDRIITIANGKMTAELTGEEITEGNLIKAIH